MAQLYAGTSGWAYPSWKPDFYLEFGGLFLPISCLP
jgi:hypothetical protein